MSSPGGLSGLLHAPLPGTRARADADLAARLQKVLTGFDGVQSANVIVARPPDSPEASPHVAVQLRLTDGFEPTGSWIRTLRTLSLRAMPHVNPLDLTIVESTGRTLLESGEALATAPPDPAPPSRERTVDRTFVLQPWWIYAATLLGFLAVIAGVLVSTLRRKDAAEELLDEPAGPLDFLTAHPVDSIATSLCDERPTVIAAILALAPDDLASRLERHAALPDDLPHLSEPPASEMAEPLAQVLRRRLQGR